MVERLWKMTRLWSGDYLLPSNDRETLWRITRYSERDGTLTRGDGSVVNGDFWRLTRFELPPDEITVEYIDTPYSREWTEVACMMPTRQAAIDYALEHADAPLPGSSPAPHDPASAGGAGHHHA